MDVDSTRSVTLLAICFGRSIQVLVSHLVWVAMGVRIIGLAMKPFFFNPEKVCCTSVARSR